MLILSNGWLVQAGAVPPGHGGLWLLHHRPGPAHQAHHALHRVQGQGTEYILKKNITTDPHTPPPFPPNVL